MSSLPPFPGVLLPAVHIPWGRRMCLLTSITSRSSTLTTGQRSSKDRLGMALLSRTASNPWVRTADDWALQRLSIFLYLKKHCCWGFMPYCKQGLERDCPNLEVKLESDEWLMGRKASPRHYGWTTRSNPTLLSSERWSSFCPSGCSFLGEEPRGIDRIRFET